MRVNPDGIITTRKTGRQVRSGFRSYHRHRLEHSVSWSATTVSSLWRSIVTTTVGRSWSSTCETAASEWRSTTTAAKFTEITVGSTSTSTSTTTPPPERAPPPRPPPPPKPEPHEQCSQGKLEPPGWPPSRAQEGHGQHHGCHG